MTISKILDEVGLARINNALREMRKIKDMKVKELRKLKQQITSIEQAIEYSRELHSEEAEELVDILIEAKETKIDPILINKLIAIFETLVVK